MRLKKLELIGFKSFADKTHLNFHEGITVVVGPNGCGKSNISDAFRWGLGEQSAKSMRGAKMPDVIFAGTSSRKPLNFAEVTIVFDNSEGILPTDYSEVALTRRLHRSGESDYLINRSNVRLKDVYDLFLDTGVGKNTFSIFEQGQIEEVIRLSPVERRYIFEEAAGILRFLQRKKEAYRRFEQTETNIERAQDICQEVEKQVVVLKQQAEQAKVFKERKQELEDLEVIYLSTKWASYNKKEQRLLQQFLEKETQITTLSREIDAGEINRQNEAIGLNHLQKSYQEMREKVLRSESEKEFKVRQKEHTLERQKEMLTKEQQWKLELEEIVNERLARKQKKQEQQQLQLVVEKELALLEQVWTDEKKNVTDYKTKVDQVNREISDLQTKRFVFLKKESEIESALKQATVRQELTDEKKQRHQDRKDKLEQLKKQIQEEADSQKIVLEEKKLDIEEKKEFINQVKKQLKQYLDQEQKLKKALDEISQGVAESSARARVLARLKQEMEGLSVGAKKLLKASQDETSPLFGKVKGLFEMLSASVGYEKSLSSVLRGYQQTLVVETRQDFNKLLDFAKKEAITDFSVLCKEDITQEKTETGCKDSFFEFVDQNAISKHFLKRVSLQKSPDEAKALLLDSNREAVVTPCGVFIDAKQVLFSQQSGENNVFLREAELKKVQKELKNQEKQKQEIEKQLILLVQEKRQAEQKSDLLEKEFRTAELKVAEIIFTAQQKQTELQKVLTEEKKWLEEAEALQKAYAEQELVISNLRHEHKGAKIASDKLQENLLALSEKKQNLDEQLKVVEEKEREKQSKFQAVAEKKQAIFHQLNLLEIQENQSAEQEKKLNNEMQGVAQNLAKYQVDEAGFEAEMKKLSDQIDQQKMRCQKTEEKIRQQQEEMGVSDKELSTKRQDLKKLETEKYELGLNLAKLSSSKSAIELELQQRYHKEVKEVDETLNCTQEAAEKQIKRLRRQIEQMGDINMTSIEECDKLQARHSFLTKQIEDLLVSKNKLMTIIAELDAKSRKVFKETFEQIRTNFKKNFEILFNGGQADLEFTDSGDILEAGVDIVAKPPGKQMRSIHLLSGGEKCLTAMALLFAIFEVKPAPFCILDEIDAPLDDTNVERFLNVVKQFTDRCQFIIISHNKRTMAIADRLFGVSMQEKGVSKILAMEFAHETSKEPVLV